MANRYLHGKRKTSNSDSALVSWSLISQQYLKVHEYWKNLLSLQRETEAENSKELFILLYGLLRDISTRSWHQKSIISPKELAYRAQNVTHPSLLCSHKQAPSPISDPLPINIKMIRSFFQFGHLAPAVISPYFFLISLFLSSLYNSLNHWFELYIYSMQINPCGPWWGIEWGKHDPKWPMAIGKSQLLLAEIQTTPLRGGYPQSLMLTVARSAWTAWVRWNPMEVMIATISSGGWLSNPVAPKREAPAEAAPP